MLLLLALPSFATTYVAVVETRSDVIDYESKLYITDKLKDCAKRTLPQYLDFEILDRENIREMLPPGKSIEDCEGSCLAETGRNIYANYIAQARIGKIGRMYTLSVVMYETKGGTLVDSFTSESEEVEDFLKDIEQKSTDFFSKLLNNASSKKNEDYSDGISGVNMGGHSYKAVGKTSYIINVDSKPQGAVFSVDGKPVPSCTQTPCDISLTEGTHRFSFGRKLHFDKDTSISIFSNEQKIFVKLSPNYGTLEFNPSLQDNLGDASGLIFKIDDKTVSSKNVKLVPGKHNATISHQCYETATFDVTVRIGSKLVFDQMLNPKTGGLDLKAEENGRPIGLPVFVNGRQKGKTPILLTIPICSKIEIGENREKIGVNLKRNQTVEYTHKIRRAQIQHKSVQSKKIDGSRSERFVAVLEIVGEAGVLSLNEKFYLTDVLRSSALKALPRQRGFVIMTRENISTMLPPGKTIMDCEGTSLVETGRIIAADYVAGARVGKFGSNFTITAELYETSGNKLLGSFTARAENLYGLQEVIQKRAPELFSKILQ